MQNAIEYRAAWEDAEARGRPHVGIGMVTGRESHFPVLSLTVKGSLHNAKTFRYVASKLQGRLTAVMDRGFMNKYAVAIASEAGIDVLGGCIENSNEVKDALMKWRDDEIERPGQVIARSSGSVLYYREWTGKLFGRKGLIVVTLDTSRRSEERGSRDLLLREATGRPDAGRAAELKEELGRVARPSRGRRGRDAAPTADASSSRRTPVSRRKRLSRHISRGVRWRRRSGR